MRQLLLKSTLLPFYGIAIKLCHRIGWYAPLIWLTKFFVSGPRATSQENICRILALTPSRFRGDLDVLDATGDFECLEIPDAWQNRLIYTFFDITPTFEAVYQPSSDQEHAAHKKQKHFLSKFLPKLHKALKVDVVISAAVHYQADYLWGAHSSKTGTPFVVFHRECFHTTPERRQFWIEKWSPTKDNYVFDFCIFHNEVIRKNYADSGVFPLEKTASFGALRMDEFVRSYYQKETPPPDKKRITLFSFTHAVGLGGKIPLWSPYDQPQGFTGMFEDVHVGFARYAAANPDVECIIKPKWGGVWVDECHAVLARHGMTAADIPNLKIIVETDVHQLIKDSSIICGYGSTTLLEAGIIGRPVVVTLMNEALNETYADQIQMQNDLKHYDVATNEQEFHDTLTRILEKPKITKAKQTKREQLFGKWISPLDASAAQNYAQCLKDVIAVKRSQELQANTNAAPAAHDPATQSAPKTRPAKRA